MYLTAQRVRAPDGKIGVNGFLYEHAADVTWSEPPKPAAGSVGELVHSFLMVPPGGNQVLSFIDIVAPNGMSYAALDTRIRAWLTAGTPEQPLPWTWSDAEVRLGLHMVSAYVKAWRAEAGRLLATCQLTIDRYTRDSTQPTGATLTENCP